MEPRGGRLDVIGIGALNTDLIVADVSAGTLMDRLRAVLGRALPAGSEQALDADEMRLVLAEVGTLGPEVVPGGSAWNTIYALARLGALTLGYVGVAGRTPPGSGPITTRLDTAGIDRRHVRVDGAALGGTCVSVQLSGERTLLTHVGANADMARHVDEVFDRLVPYLAGARAVHVTSFLDPDSPERLAAVLHAAKRANPGMLISLDPGHVWATTPTPAIHALVTLADVLLLNGHEFAALSPRADDSEPDEIVAHRLLERSDALTVVKGADGVRTYRRAADGRVEADFHPTRRLPVAEIRDDTGAGDVFAAGLLAGLLSGAGTSHGVRLGMALARYKLQYLGTRGHAGFPGVAAELVR
jgi:sugar/nucleoside kinase (ribokinase family)